MSPGKVQNRGKEGGEGVVVERSNHLQMNCSEIDRLIVRH